jgi:hypothetical protein
VGGWYSEVGENQPRQSILARASGITAIGLALALVIGIQLGGIPWRYCKQPWQLQGAAIGTVVGYPVGRLDRGEG